MDDQMCGKRYDNPRKPNRDVCILERGHEGGCENNIGQTLPTVTTIEQRRNRERLLSMSSEEYIEWRKANEARGSHEDYECINGLRQEEMG
jgi:hypothetical protein